MEGELMLGGAPISFYRMWTHISTL